MNLVLTIALICDGVANYIEQLLYRAHSDIYIYIYIIAKQLQSCKNRVIDDNKWYKITKPQCEVE